MHFYLDTANLDEIRFGVSMGVVEGVTTNPSLIAKEGVSDFHSHIRQIASIVKGPVSAEVISCEFEGMVSEGRELSGLASNVVVKIPLTVDGLRAVKALSEEGISTNATLVFSAAQAMLAARAGAAFVSPFLGRIDDTGASGAGLVRQIREIFDIHLIDTAIIAASVRHPQHVLESAQSGAHIATIPLGVLRKLVCHPLTDAGISLFLNDWEALQKKHG